MKLFTNQVINFDSDFTTDFCRMLDFITWKAGEGFKLYWLFRCDSKKLRNDTGYIKMSDLSEIEKSKESRTFRDIFPELNGKSLLGGLLFIRT